MKPSKNGLKKAGIIALFIVTLVVTAYAGEAYYAASFITHVDGKPMWVTAPPGSFYPWPKPPGPFDLNFRLFDTDMLIYTYLIQTFVVAIVTVLLWALLVWNLLKIRRPRRKVKPKKWE
jgi:hypothetical protein